ncbi:hypothetical protein CJD_A0149 [Clostridium perfringens D str. JGS1721]|uniref:Uncharacterized protein n=1 Tax=Clostridium perfringens D str. JGS1721 TaxID=488537 RepID=B1V841_CLOPF|nr:hypothetical protein [Clostridium perfringens]EDT70022.1 hypothetical protein CJD_A0149 [Clostridium perfringens D str. JGS1721]
MFIISNNLILVMVIIALVVLVLSAWDKGISYKKFDIHRIFTYYY